MDKNEQKNIFSKNLKFYLKRQGKTQSDLVNDLHLSSSTVSDWANGKKYPRMDKVQMIADYLGVYKSDLIEDKPKNNNRNYRTVTTSKSRTMYDSIHFGLINDYFGDNAIYNKLIEALEEYKEDEELLNDTYDYFNFLIYENFLT